jgi:hypothetical protein
MASSSPQEHNDADMDDPNTDAAPPSTRAQAAEGSSTAVSAATEQPQSLPKNSSQQQRTEDFQALFQRDPMVAIAYGYHALPTPHPDLPAKNTATPGGLAFEQRHLPPEERKPRLHVERTMKNLVEYGSLNDPSEVVKNDPRNIPSVRETIERAKRERLRKIVEKEQIKREREEADKEEADKKEAENEEAENEEAEKKKAGKERTASEKKHVTLVFCGESRRDSKIPPADDRLPRVNASRFQSGANCMHVVKLKRVAMQS